MKTQATLPQKILDWASIAVMTASFAVVAVAWGRLPDKIPAHYRERIYSAVRTMLCWLKLETLLTFGYLTWTVTLGRRLSPAFLPVVLTAVFGSIIYYSWKTFAIAKKSR
jgi:hypothetical protein